MSSITKSIIFGFILVFLLLLTLSGCAAAESLFREPTAVPTQTPISCLLLSNYKNMVVTTLPKSTVSPNSTHTPPLPSSIDKPPSTIPPTSQETNNIHFSICSPLQDIEIAELPTIISCPYNPPPPGKDDKHQGVDFAYYHYKEQETILGEKVQAVMPGIVSASLSDTFPYGNFIIIETPYSFLPATLISSLGIAEGESIYSLYAHLNTKPFVSFTETVESCQIIGEVGKSGNTAAPHLHFETRIGPPNQTFSSMSCFVSEATVEERANYRRWRTSGTFRHFDPMDLLQLNIPDLTQTTEK